MQTKYTADDLARKILHDADLGPHMPPEQIRHILSHFPGVADLVEAAYRLGCEDADAQDEQYQEGYAAGKEADRDADLYTWEEIEPALSAADADGHRRGMEAGRALAEAGLLDRIRSLVSAETDRVAADEYRRGRAEADSENYAVGYARGYEDAKDDLEQSEWAET